MNAVAKVREIFEFPNFYSDFVQSLHGTVPSLARVKLDSSTKKEESASESLLSVTK